MVEVQHLHHVAAKIHDMARSDCSENGDGIDSIHQPKPQQWTRPGASRPRQSIRHKTERHAMIGGHYGRY
jgi:hypothetical protein